MSIRCSAILRCVSLALFALALLAPASAKADTLFLLNGTLQDGTGVFTGTVSYRAGEFGRVTGTLTDGSYKFVVPSSYLGENLDEGSFNLVDVFAVNATFDLSLYLPNSIGPNGMGGQLCSLSMPCVSPFPRGTAVVSAFSDGTFPRQAFQTLTATNAATPEPNSLVLLGTGLGGLSMQFWRRARRRRMA